MDGKKTSSQIGDNRNVPSDIPKNPPLVPDGFNKTSSVASTTNSNDPHAPFKADPLNGGIPNRSAIDAEDGVIEIEDELGGTGTLIFDGFLAQADYNPDWNGWQRVKIADEMRLSDSTISLGLAAVKHPILQGRWYIKPGEGEDDDGEKTTFLRQELMQNPNFSFLQTMREAMLYCDYGAMNFEKVFRMRRDGKVGWRKFGSRLPNTIFRYTLDDGKSPGITQILPTGGHVQIPQWKLIMYILELEGANYEGHSLLRSAYQHYFYKKLYYKIDAISAQRQGCGFPVIHVPPQATPEDKAVARKVAKNLRVNEFAYVELPEGFKLEWVDMKANGIKDLEKVIEHHDRQELAAFRAQFLKLGATTAGSQHASQDQKDLFYLSENYLAKVYQEPTQIACNELIDLNFSSVKPEQYPTLQFAGIGKLDFESWTKALLNLAQGGYILPTDDDERHIRQEMDLPEAVKFSDEQYTDPEMRKIPVPQIDPNNPNEVQQKKPVRYVNREMMRDAMRFMEDMRELENRIQDSIEKKKPVSL